jgi:hypothetical protein
MTKKEKKGKRQETGSIPIIRCRKNSHQSPPMLNLIPRHPNLMTPNHRLQPILLTKPFRDIRAKLQSDASLTWSASGIWLGIRPEHFVDEALVCGLATEVAVYFADVVEGYAVFGEEAAVEDEEFLGDEGCEGEGGEGFGEHLEGAVVVSERGLVL